MVGIESPEDTPPKMAHEIAVLVELEEPATALLNENQSAREFVSELIKNGHHADAIRVLAQALPKRLAIRWAFSVVAAVTPDSAPVLDRLALDSVRQWLEDPSEEKRRASMNQAESIEFKTPAAWTAVSVFWSGGSITPVESPDIPPAPGMMGKAVAGAILLAAVKTSPENATEKMEQYVAQGLDLGKEAGVL